MTTIDVGVARRPWWRFFGPWPIRPGLLSLVGFLYYLTYRAGQQGGVMLLAPASLRDVVLPGAVGALGVLAVAWVGRAWQRRFGVHWGNYLFTHVAITAFATALRLTGLIGIDIVGLVPNIQTFLRFLGTFVITSAVAGAVLDRLERQVAATEEALAIAREQQVQIITADEEARRQVSIFLHDRVQAGLLASCLELRAALKTMHATDRERLLPTVERLEDLRAIDVRRAARSLSPNLDEVGLQTAIEDLAAQFDASFTTDVVVDRQLERTRPDRDSVIPLAIYRIVDQALINVAAHADATHVRVKVIAGHDAVSVTIEDDGRGMPANPMRGLGSTIITTWVRAVEGSWTLAPGAAARGTRLEVRLPMETPL